MCFSAEASFVGGVIISTIGAASLKQVQEPKQVIFASIPLIFGLQQIAEGFLWLSLLYQEFAVVNTLSTYTFLILAQVIWPIIIPLSTWLLEENKKRKKTLHFFIIIGCFLSLYYTYCLLSFNINPQIIDCHIKYNADYPKTLVLVTFSIYLSVTIAPLYVSTLKNIRTLAVLMSLSCLISIVFFTYWVTSVWCFFAAIISMVVFWLLRNLKKNTTKKTANQ